MLMWNSSGYYEVDVEFFRGMPIIVMESVLSFEYFKLRAWNSSGVMCFELRIFQVYKVLGLKFVMSWVKDFDFVIPQGYKVF